MMGDSRADRLQDGKEPFRAKIRAWTRVNRRFAGAVGRERPCVSTVGLDETTVRRYIRNQEKQDRRQEELDL